MPLWLYLQSFHPRRHFSQHTLNRIESTTNEANTKQVIG